MRNTNFSGRREFFCKICVTRNLHSWLSTISTWFTCCWHIVVRQNINCTTNPSTIVPNWYFPPSVLLLWNIWGILCWGRWNRTTTAGLCFDEALVLPLQVWRENTLCQNASEYSKAAPSWMNLCEYTLQDTMQNDVLIVIKCTIVLKVKVQLVKFQYFFSFSPCLPGLFFFGRGWETCNSFAAWPLNLTWVQRSIIASIVIIIIIAIQ